MCRYRLGINAGVGGLMGHALAMRHQDDLYEDLYEGCVGRSGRQRVRRLSAVVQTKARARHDLFRCSLLCRRLRRNPPQAEYRVSRVSGRWHTASQVSASASALASTSGLAHRPPLSLKAIVRHIGSYYPPRAASLPSKRANPCSHRRSPWQLADVCIAVCARTLSTANCPSHSAEPARA